MTKKNVITEWMGNDFFSLHPLLQELHIHGGVLKGNVDIQTGNNSLSHYLGQRLAKKLGIPVSSGTHTLQVAISHNKDTLIWERIFDDIHKMTSIFKPIGIKQSGFLLEESGPQKMRLTIDVKDGGWYWRWLDIKSKDKNFFKFILPYSEAYKYINENNEYVFCVKFKFFGLGNILTYKGVLHKVSTVIDNHDSVTEITTETI